MQQVYKLSAGALLYALYKLRCHGMYGLPMVMPDPETKAFAPFAQKCEEELMAAGIGTMNFDGELELGAEFSALLRSCSGCHAVAGAALHSEHTWQKVTLYPDAGALLVRDEQEKCILRTTQDAAAELMNLLALPESVPQVEALEVNTDRLEQKDREGLKADGCPEELADALMADFAGAGGYAHIVRTVFRSRTDDLLLLYGEGHRLSAAAGYADGQEWLRLTPVTTEEVAEQVRQMAAPMFEEFDEDAPQEDV